MKAHYLGHVVFYRDLLGFQKVGSIFNGAAAALASGRTHHELLLIQVRDVPAHRREATRALSHRHKGWRQPR